MNTLGGPIAILGATSQIAHDFIRRHDDPDSLVLFSRHPEALSAWLKEQSLPSFHSAPYAEFAGGKYAVVMNFVGSGDPARIAGMGAEIFNVTLQYDTLAVDYLVRHPATRYIFLSSGAAYGATFLRPAAVETQAVFSANALSAQDFYGIAKLHAEARHRAMADHAITDIRIFAYFSRHSDIAKRFFITDVLRAIRDQVEFETGADTMSRDYTVPQDFAALVAAILQGLPRNAVVDAYSRAPVEKFALLNAMREKFGLRYRTVERPSLMLATGAKPEYYSTNKSAAEFGYTPALTSLDGVLQESAFLLGR